MLPWGIFKTNLTVTVDVCRVGSGGACSASDWFSMSWKGATSLRCGGQTRLISLQRPLKFLPWDINEVIHRKAAAHHTALPPHTHLPISTTYCNLHSPSPPAALRLHLGRATLCQGRSPYSSPWERDSSRSMAPGAGGGGAEGVARAAVRVSQCQERVTTTWLRVLHQQKNNVSSRTNTMVWGMVVLSPYFIYFCLPVVYLSLAVTSN